MNLVFRAALCALPLAAMSLAAGLTGNWVVEQDMHDGTYRRTYLDLHDDGSKITGHIRVTQFYYTISSSSQSLPRYTVTGTMMDGHNPRSATWEVRLDGDRLMVGTRRRPDDPLTELPAHRAPEGEGAYPK